MIFEISRESDNDKVREFLISNNIPYEERDEAFDSWDGINIYETLTVMLERNPELDGDSVGDEVYRRTPKIVEALRKQYINDKSYGVEDSPVLILEDKIREFYIGVIEEEIEKIQKELDV